MGSIAKLFVEVGANTQQFKRGMQDVNDSIHHTSKQASNFGNIINTAIGTGLGIAATKAVSSLVNLGKSIVDTGIEFNNLEQNSLLAFETMLQSGDKAKAMMSDLKTFAKKTPFELPGLIENTQRLLAFGFESQKIIPMLTNIGDAVAGLGGSPEKLNRVILALGQIKAKGKVMASEMLQLTEAGIPAWQMLADKIGVSIPEAMKMGEKGMLDADTAIGAILEGMDKRFGGLMGKQAKSWSGMLSNIKDTFTQVSGRVMKPLFDLGLKGMEKLLALFDSPVFESFVKRMEGGTKALASFLGGLGSKIASLFSGDFKGFFNGLFGNFEKLSKFLAKYENKRFGWLSNFTPKEALTAVQGFIADLKNGSKYVDYWIGHMPRLFQPMAKIAVKAVDMWKYLSGDGIQATLKKLGSILVGLGSTLAKLVRPFKDALGGLFQQLATMKNMGFADIFKAVISSIVAALKGFIAVIKEEFWPSIKSGLVWLWNSLWSFFTSINWSDVWSAIVDGFNAIVSFIASIDWSAVGESVKAIFNTIASYVSSIDWAGIWSVIWSSLKGVFNFLVELLGPPLSSFFSWLVSWFTDPNKRQQIWNALQTTWNFLGEWASYLWGLVSPYLASFWSNLVTWTTEVAIPNLSHWSLAFVSWSANLWSDYLKPKMVSWWTSFESWMVATFPATKVPLENLRTNFISFFDQIALLFGIRSGSLSKDWGVMWADFFSISKLNLEQLIANVINLGANFVGALEVVVYLFRNLVQGNWSAVWEELKRVGTNAWSFLASQFNFNGPDSQAIVNGVKMVGDGIYNAFVGALHTIGKAYDDYVVQPIRNATSELVNYINSALSSFNSFSGFTVPTIPIPGFATGGNILDGGVKLVGERGPELVDLPMGSRVYDHGQSMGKMNSSSGSVSEVRIINESKFPIDRTTVQEIARALQRELNLQGNRVVFAS